MAQIWPPAQTKVTEPAAAGHPENQTLALGRAEGLRGQGLPEPRSLRGGTLGSALPVSSVQG